jgi:hypothetical protein
MFTFEEWANQVAERRARAKMKVPPTLPTKEELESITLAQLMAPKKSPVEKFVEYFRNANSKSESKES